MVGRQTFVFDETSFVAFLLSRSTTFMKKFSRNRRKQIKRKMVNILAIHGQVIRGILKLVGMRSQKLEVEPGTVINFWLPNEKQNKKKERPAIVFLHGFTGNGILTWQFQVLSLAKSYNIYVPDLLFFGASITDRPERSPEFQAECVVKGLKMLGVERWTVVGFSYGGLIGFKMAELYPSLVESMVITGSSTRFSEPISEAALQRIGFKSWPDFLVCDSADAVEILFKIGSYKVPWVPRRVYKDYFKVMFDHRKEMEKLLEGLLHGGHDNATLKYGQKIHLLWGKDDIIFNVEVAENLKKQLGGQTQLKYIEKAGHIVQLERPCLYNRCLKQILASLHEADVLQ